MITAQIETIEACLPELLKIWPLHWEELALFKDKIRSVLKSRRIYPTKSGRNAVPSYDPVERRDGGIFHLQCGSGFHYGETLTGTTDIYYVVAEFRERGLFFPLYRCVDRELRRRGVAAFYCGWKTAKPLNMDRMLPLLGFIPADTYMIRWLGANDHKREDQGI